MKLSPLRRRYRRKCNLEDFLPVDGTIRIPVSGSVPLSKAARYLMDSRDFQRLRGVRQLGPAHLVYPGATHTRFEHSLGTYSLSLRYVRALLAKDDFYHFPNSPTDMAKLLVASSLLHDIGHYPFSHLFEEIGSLPGLTLEKHEDRARQIILSSEIAKILKEYWGLDPELVTRAIKGDGLRDGFAVMSTALDSVLDLDKMDYLIRDSVHCGVDFGFALDTERFLCGLTVNRNNASIALSTKAQSYIPTLITVRNAMYSEVYWHKTVRAAGAMLKTLIYLLCERKALTQSELRSLLNSQDDIVSHRLYSLAKQLQDVRLQTLARPFLFRRRGLFKMVYVFSATNSKDKPQAMGFFKDILEEKRVDLSVCLRKAQALERIIRQCGTPLKSGDLLVEDTPVKPGHEAFELDNLQLFDERTHTFVGPSYDISMVDNHLRKSRRVFVFCNPSTAHLCTAFSTSDWEDIFLKTTTEPAR